VREGIFETLFIRYGAGSDLIKRLTASKTWNIVAWILILLGVLAWIVFLRWNPAGD
jgi:high-affinity Fe2+/Pb2+ permease